MPTYTVEVIATDRRVYKVKEAQNDLQAETIAKDRFEADAPIDLVEESRKITRVNVTSGQNDDATDGE
jgi:hypothetical protein